VREIMFPLVNIVDKIIAVNVETLFDALSQLHDQVFVTKI
jgi:hypothetical protein